MSGEVKLVNWLREAQRTDGDRTIPFTPLALVRARQLFSEGLAPEDCVPQLRTEGLLE